MRALPQRLPAILAGLAGLVVAHLALSAVGSYATVDDGASVAGHTLHVVLPGGQNDRLELSMLDADHLGIAYAGTSVPAGDECQQVAPRLIGCAADGLDRVHIDTGDGDDVVDTSRISYDTEIDTGAGDDTVHGGRGADLVSGGEGTDTVSYLSTTRTTSGVYVSLDGKPNDGGAFEGDNVGRDVEDIVGTLAADVLIGNEGANVFVGHGGADVIDGNGGFDVVVPDTRLSP